MEHLYIHIINGGGLQNSCLTEYRIFRDWFSYLIPIYLAPPRSRILQHQLLLKRKLRTRICVSNRISIDECTRTNEYSTRLSLAETSLPANQIEYCKIQTKKHYPILDAILESRILPRNLLFKQNLNRILNELRSHPSRDARV